MPHRDLITNYLNSYLKIDEFQDFGPKGLQVQGKEDVQKIITGVSCNLEFFEKAVNAHADMIIVHHGLIWDRESHVVKGHFKKRLKILLDHNITLLAYHLPLDAHPDIGNNALAAKALGIEGFEEFDGIGIQGKIPSCTSNQFIENVKKLYGREPFVYNYGPSKVEHIAICSGGAEKSISLAIEHGLDAFVTGEVSLSIMHLAKENNIHFLSVGHHVSERLGIRALGDHLSDVFDVDVSYIDVYNPI